MGPEIFHRYFWRLIDVLLFLDDIGGVLVWSLTFNIGVGYTLWWDIYYWKFLGGVCTSWNSLWSSRDILEGRLIYVEIKVDIKEAWFTWGEGNIIAYIVKDLVVWSVEIFWRWHMGETSSDVLSEGRFRLNMYPCVAWSLSMWDLRLFWMVQRYEEYCFCSWSIDSFSCL